MKTNKRRRHFSGSLDGFHLLRVQHQQPEGKLQLVPGLERAKTYAPHLGTATD